MAIKQYYKTILIVVILSLVVLIFAKPPAIHVCQPEQQALDSDTVILAFLEEKGEATSQSFSYTFGKAMLFGEEGAMEKDTSLSILGIDSNGLPPMTPGMVNVTGEYNGFRMLPHGMRFNRDITITLPYDSLLIPAGYTPADIRTYYYDEGYAAWRMVEFDRLDVDRQCVVSKVNHFTDFINAIIKTPEMSETSAFVPTMMNDLECANPLAGIPVIAAPTANNMGSARFSYPVNIPDGRAGMQPQLSVTYDNNGGSGWMGEGWDLAVSCISIDTRWGVPWFDSQKESEIYMLDGKQLATKDAAGYYQPLPNRGNWVNRYQGPKRFYLRVEGGFLKIMRYGNAPSNYYWEVTDKDGTVGYYGKPVDGDGDDGNVGTLKNLSGDIVRWYLTETKDTDGNIVRYYYDHYVGGGTAERATYLRRVNYTGHVEGNTVEDGAYDIWFCRDSMSGMGFPVGATNCRNGLVETNDQLLTKIIVKRGNAVLLSNCFYYKTGRFGKVLLDEISLSPRNSDGSNVLYSFGYYGENDTTGIFGPQTIIHIDGGGRHFEESDNSSWSIGGSAGAGTGFGCNKALTVGVPFSYSEDESTGRSTLIDIDGDALPELLYQEGHGDNACLRYQKLQRNVFGLVFSGAFPVTGINTFLHEETSTEAVGAEGVLTDLSAMYNHSWSQSSTDTYFSEVNGDGYPDLVSDGSVYLNTSPPQGGPGRHFVLGDRNVSEYLFDTDVDESLFGDTVCVETRYWLPDGTGWLVSRDTIVSDSLPLPDFDAVRMWEAPYDGVVTGDFSATLDNRLDNSRRHDFIMDGVRVSVQLNDGQNGRNWSAVLVANDSLFSPNVGGITVHRGDRLFFRVESMRNRKYDHVRWSPRIWYEGAYLQGEDAVLDPNGHNPLVFDASDDFLVNPGYKYYMPFQGKASVVGTVSVTQPLNDTVRVKVHHNNIVVDSNQYNAGNAPCVFQISDSLDIAANDSVWISIECLSNVRWSTIRCDASIVIGEGVVDGDTLRPDRGDTLMLFSPIIPILTNYPNPVLPTTNITGLNSMGAFSVVMTGSDTDGSYWLVVKRRNRAKPALFKKRIEVVNGRSDSINVNVDFTTSDTLCFELFTDKALKHGDVLSATMLTASSEISLGLYGQHEGSKRIFGEMNRNWGLFAYQDEGYGGLVDTSLLHLAMDTALFPIDSLLLCDSALLNSPEYDLSRRSFATMSADYKNHRQVGLAGQTFVSGEGMGNFNPNVFDAALRNRGGAGDRSTWVAVRKKSKAGSDNGNVFLVCTNSTNTKILSDYMDLNGDRYPDVLTDAKAQYSKPQGGLSNLIAGFRPFNGDAVNKSNSTGIGINFCGSQAKTETDLSQTNGMQKMAVTYNGTSIGGNESNSSVTGAWLDVNGDGLPDIVNGRETFLNLGYSYAKSPNNIIMGNIQEGYSLSGSVGVGFNLVSTSFQGGFGVSSGMTMGKRLYADVNGDGLPDRITTTAPSLTYGTIRDLFGGGNQELSGIESINTQMSVEFNTGQGFGFGEAFSHVMASQYVHYGRSANEAATVAWWVWIFVKMFTNEQGYVADGSTWSKWQMVDMDGDGLSDLVCQGANADRMKVFYNQTGKCNMLKSVSSKMNGLTTVDYELSEPSEAYPQRIWTMSDLAIDDGHHGDGVDVIHFTFEYDSAYYDRLERESYGFAVVKTHTLADGFVYRTQTDRYHTEDYLRKGLKYNETLTDSKGNILIERTMDYVPLIINSGVQALDFNRGNVYPALVEETIQYENSPIIEKKTFQYAGEYGNVTHYEHFALGDDERLVADIHYYCDGAQYIVGVPDSIAVKDNLNHLLRARACDMDFMTGHVTTIRNHNSAMGLSGDIAQFDYTYDGYGNIVTCVGPTDANGQRMELEYAYDSDFHSHPVSVANSLGDVSRAHYHPLWGKPTDIIDINGNIMAYEYDDMGRVSQVKGPLDPQYSIRHYYWFDDGVFNALGCVAKTEHYDCQHPNNPMVVSTRCDALGRVVQTKKELEINGVEVLQVSGHVKYDALGRPDSVFYPIAEPLNGLDPWCTYCSAVDNQPPTVYSYDMLDRKQSVTLPDGATTWWSYYVADIDGRYLFCTTVTDANGVSNQTFADYRGLTLRSVADAPNEAVVTGFTYSMLGELTSVTDPYGAVTKYDYDMLGRCTSRFHPDAGNSTFTFDLADNLVQERNANGDTISYNYLFNRLTDVSFSSFPENNVHYRYGNRDDGINGAGHVVKTEDESGVGLYSYDAMGNVSENYRIFVLPAEDSTYTFIMSAEYDAWGRTLTITYPDNETVGYAYDLGGNLKSVSANKAGVHKSIVDSICYDQFGDRVAVHFGNGTKQTYTYNPLSRRLDSLRARTSANVLMQDIAYAYDGVGNVTGIFNAAEEIGDLGGRYLCSYSYDALNRLTITECQQGGGGYVERRTYLNDGRIETYNLNGTRRGYSYNSTQPHTLANIHSLPNRLGLFTFGWDANGNMTSQTDMSDNRRVLRWDERNHLLAVVDHARNGSAALYGYAAQGERSFKLTGYTNTGAGENPETLVSLDEPTLYASPYLTATAAGYTKHYFAGAERIASSIGNGGLEAVGMDILDVDVVAAKRMERAAVLNRVMDSCRLRINNNRLAVLYGMTQADSVAELTYFFHPDHLGSASWITDMSGQPVQHLQYKPFGESFIDQHDPNSDYTERFRFTGKERDTETGYDYFGARYYSSTLGIWLSVDPLSDKYPSLSPYVYCADNPMRVVDPKGDTLVIDGKGLTKSDVLSIVGPKYQNRITFENCHVFVDVNGLTDDEIKDDAGFSLINDLSNSDNRYLFETKIVNNAIGIENNSVTPKFETNNKGDVLPEGFQGYVALNETNIWFDDKNNEINRASLVFHELQENYERTDNLLPYTYMMKIYHKNRLVNFINDPNRKGAHETAILKAAKLTPSARSSYPEGNVHHLNKD